MGESRMDAQGAGHNVALWVLLEVSLLEAYWILGLYGSKVGYWRARGAQSLLPDESFPIPHETSSS